MTRDLKRLRRTEDGAVAVEAAITIGILLLLVLGVIQFAILFYQWNTMTLAVEEVGRHVMVSQATSTPCRTAACAETALQTILTNASLCTNPSADETCVSAEPAAGTPSTMTLTAAYGFDFLFLGPFTLTSQGRVPLD